MLELSMKEHDLDADRRAAVAKYVPECITSFLRSLICFYAHRKRTDLLKTSTRVQRKRRQIMNDMSAVTSLIRNQEGAIKSRLRYISRDSVKAEKLREEILRKQGKAPANAEERGMPGNGIDRGTVSIQCLYHCDSDSS